MPPHWLLPAIFRRIDLVRPEGLEPRPWIRGTDALSRSNYHGPCAEPIFQG
jgi:hypothetical protein